MRVLVVNPGSSSLKASLVVDGERVEDDDVAAERGGEELAAVLDRWSPVDAAGVRFVHGGPDLTAPVLVDDEVLRTLEGTVELAPLHNPTSLAVARTLRDAGLRVVACFDTAFHATLPAAAATYALPRAWNRAWRLRRYGFHGLSYEYVAARAAEQLGRPLAELRLVLCHLGGGASACAVVGGRSVDTTMGFTPMEGLAMQVRSGSVDPGLLLWLLQTGRVGLDELADALEHRSGLAGLSGTSGDIREVLAGLDAGDQDCRLAFDVYVHRLAAAVGAMAASAGGLDALVFTGGVGEHVARVRDVLAERLAHLGPVPVLVIATGEDLAIAAHVERLL
jgi:acetate kinase